ncbi:MAG: hypothetical protein JKY48_16880 [Flavobacteriales bacterium]|nr:hypothetical protein [Flavobacteriales bacterium]
MKKTLTTLSLCFLFIFNISAQHEKSYADKKGNKHLCGSFELEALKNDTTYSDWYQKNYTDYKVELNKTAWKKNLKSTKVDIYLGTWCGDSRTWVPRFVRLWDELGLDKKQLNFIGLYNGDEKYKQGPNGEELGKKIHRVPTFIFTENEVEIGRIVEFPNTSLETDLAQIALGYPSAASYKGANYLLEVLENNPIDSIKANYRYYINQVYKKVSKSSELNTLGYVLLRSNRIKEAALNFQMNTLCFSSNPNTYDSYGEALAAMGETEAAIKQYKKVLSFKPEDENALAQLKILEAKE